jgi:hypothetical protein
MAQVVLPTPPFLASNATAFMHAVIQHRLHAFNPSMRLRLLDYIHASIDDA